MADVWTWTISGTPVTDHHADPPHLFRVHLVAGTGVGDGLGEEGRIEADHQDVHRSRPDHFRTTRAPGEADLSIRGLAGEDARGGALRRVDPRRGPRADADDAKKADEDREAEQRR